MSSILPAQTPDAAYATLTFDAIGNAPFYNVAFSPGKAYKYIGLATRSVDNVISEDFFFSFSPINFADPSVSLPALQIGGKTPFCFPLVSARLLYRYTFPCGMPSTIYFHSDYRGTGTYKILIVLANDMEIFNALAL